MKVAVIPARGGSKRIPRKNIREFCGKPMIAWPIETSQNSSLFDHIIVSTDDDEIARVAQQYGAEVPFRRPPQLADDHTPTRPVINHALGQIEDLYGLPNYVCTIYPTAPFLQVSDLRCGLEKIINDEADFAFSVTEFAYPIQRALRINSTKRIEMVHPEYRDTRSQDLEPTYHDAGQFYWGRTTALIDGRPTVSDNSIPVLLPNWRAIDIDTEEDWFRAELLHKTTFF
ncbi:MULTISPECIES: pseudaminic acid cytidylyltransferase [unclassified Halorhodospira]|uniref:pseudaminic acid cytidylyltransferase n=1 Tax=unclassified Halorhodospira TaxID=2626748 RepID=UPI001EE90FF7|nr:MULTISPECIES: pseudaminic acid cytidylyltransferase [unclassified Halorhodospira]MCG5541868.1 pseudaminic acid cytidylyltransferase [Halorhodospira sp. M39old]MCG5546941.1 pseudaminic acid cytidylyltransferase [Halorhodospira sp. M38]